MIKLYELLESALEDFKKCEANPNVTIYMEDWILWYNRTECKVCLAGAVLYQRGIRDWEQISNSEVRAEMYAINALREGRINDAYEYLHGESCVPLDYDDINVEDYVTDKEQFHKDILVVLDYLKAMDI